MRKNMNAKVDYRDKADKWEKIYGIKAQNDTMQEKYKIIKGEYASKKNKCHNEKIEGQDKKLSLFKVC